MITYIAFLRGINVGGKNIIKMTELKRVFEALGLFEVQTYIQSGNVLFKALENEDYLRNRIEHELNVVFGRTIPVVLRTAAELECIIMNCPFSPDEVSNAESSSGVESLYVAFLAKEPQNDKVKSLEAYKSDQDNFKIVGRDIFLLFSNSIRNSKLANNLQKIDNSATVRNWKTISKLSSMAIEMET